MSTTTPVVLNHTAPPTLVAQPARMPGRFGLFSAANLVPQPEPRFESGVEFDTAACEIAGGTSGVCVDTATIRIGDELYGEAVRLGANVGTETALPFAVYGWYDCSAFGRPLGEAVDRAREHLLAGEERAVERAVHEGDLDNEPSFQTATDLTPGGGASVVEGLAILESWLGEQYGAVGVVHTPRRAVARMGDYVSRQGQRLETRLGTYVAAGGGYDAAQRTLLDGGTARLYATSIPTIRRSEVFVTPDPSRVLNRNRNDVVAVAQRVYVVGWECVTGRVDVSLGVEGA